MKRDSKKRSFLKLFFIILFTAAFVTLVSHDRLRGTRVSASASGPTPSHTNAPGEANCTACHADYPVNSGTGSVSIGTLLPDNTIGPLPANYLPNQQIQVTVRTAQADAVIYGFQVTALDRLGRIVGTYTLPTQTPMRQQTMDGIVGGVTRRYVEHTIDGIIPAQFGSNSWTFTWTAPNQRVGKVSFYAAGNAANSDGSPSSDYIYTTSKGTLSGSAISNFDADGKSDLAVFRPSTGVWYSFNSTDGNIQQTHFGANGDKATPGDFDGDGKTDRAVWRPSTGVWYVEKSTGGYFIMAFGSTGDIPVQGDYDSDLKTDIAVWRPSTSVWYIMRSSNGTFDFRQFGVATDKVAQGDYDADGKTDIAVWRPSTGVWYIWKSTDNNYIISGFGVSEDKPIQGDYDGDGRTDIAVFRPSTGIWYLLQSTDGFAAAQFGVAVDKPSPADYDGDGKTDIAVYRDGTWYILRSSDGAVTITGLGVASDTPVPAGYISE